MENHATSRKFSPEVRERAVRMVLDHRSEHPSRVGSDRVDRGQDRLHGTNAQRVDEEGRRRQRAQARPDDGHGSQG